MFKITATAAITLCLVFSVAYAETTTRISGEYSAEGTYIDEQDIKYQYYSHELDLYASITNDATTLKIEAGITDKTWGDESTTDTGSEFELDRAWLAHDFGNGFQLEIGKMTGDAWGTMLGDYERGLYRVRGTKAFENTTVTGYVQKNIENGSIEPIQDNKEKDDSDSVSLGTIHKIGDIKLMPMVVYTHDSDAVPDRDVDGNQELVLVFAALGTIGAVNFETEVNYIDFASDSVGTPDYSIVNLWADVNIDFGSVTTGIALAYGTEDNGAGRGSFGNDFAPMVLMDNDVDDGVIDDLGAMTLGKIYASAEPFEKLSTGCAFAYGDYEENAHVLKTGNTRVFELDLTARYAITEALTYSISVAYADVESDYKTITQVENTFVFIF